ncbi:hypothetical protein PtrSN002B_002706 [Pyrenophora tritici-repentis]|uniref:Uncharacterized protein n=1 Tax=Pyrenophora tritici-repentis TaxID=45151 RepID=A0A2W1GA91_9PLEO|nr:hypothetical protein A1F94_009274 [Pyrenophora tritici-repentis]KAI1512548.1 hypothetical protein Ptr86124_008514 [Pyrenophora tritici-repentis]KAI1543484.1 hypothetical protein PtrSN001A_003063 [Pyrenophora tritici-repentis]KAI1549317.1 hypothetical protein PtrSN001C_001782 [Pyrenophora tritici-repentis]KAI1555827.1 hypothetical protein PtrSN002B_002706 [Pyrenophora tritici-repentis]
MNNITGNASTSNDTSMSGVQQGQGQREDYLDKGLDAAEKKWGGSAGQNTEKNRGVNEKIVRLFHQRIPQAACLKKRPARTSPTKSQTKPRAQTLPEFGTDAAADTSTGKCSGLKEKWSKLDEKWNKCRPYVERINGTIVPLRSRDEEFEERFAAIAIERSRTV